MRLSMFFSTWCIFFLQGFHIQFGGADMLHIQSIDLFGTALLATSPFLVAAFYARPSKLLLLTVWGVIGAMITVQLFYHNEGFIQAISQRFSLDYFPVLMLFVAWGTKQFPVSFLKATIVWSVVLNIFSVFASIFLYGIPR